MFQIEMEGISLNTLLLVLHCIILVIGACGGPLIMRLYFLNGGKRVWLSSWLETGGWPIILIPLIVSYINRRKTEGSNAKLFFMKPLLFMDCAFIGFLIGIDDYFTAYGSSKLPVSTSSLIIATQLSFCAGFAFVLLKQRFTAYSITAIVLLTIGAAVLGFHASNDWPEGESNMEYILGLLMTLAAAALFGFILPLVELMYVKAKQEVTYTLVMETQMVMCFFATVFCTLGMFINNDFEAIPKEARTSELGEAKYYVILLSSVVILQCFYVGATGVVFCASSLLSNIIVATHDRDVGNYFLP